MAQVTVTKMEWVKDENGNHVYTGLDKFRVKLAKQAEASRQFLC